MSTANTYQRELADAMRPLPLVEPPLTIEYKGWTITPEQKPNLKWTAQTFNPKGGRVYTGTLHASRGDALQAAYDYIDNQTGEESASTRAYFARREAAQKSGDAEGATRWE